LAIFHAINLVATDGVTLGVQEASVAALQDQAGEAARAVGAGVDADAVGPNIGLGLDRVAVHHPLIEALVGLQERVADPNHVAFLLVVDGDTGAQAGVNEQIIPIASLPEWLQPVAWAIPAFHAFEGMRSVLFDGAFRHDLLVNAIALNVVQLGLFLYTIRVARHRGLLL